MDAFQLRRFPIRVRPEEGEALDSWLEACAARLRVSWGELLQACDLSSRLHTAQLAFHLSPKETNAIEAVTSVPSARVEAMTLERYRGRAIQFTPENIVRRHVLWGRGSGSRYCPYCLSANEGRWRIEWRLGWAYMCTVHNCLLLEYCPTCGTTPRSRPHPDFLVPVPRLCSSRAPGTIGGPRGPSSGRSAPRCRFDLATATAPKLGLDARPGKYQRTLLDAIDSGTATFGIYADNQTPIIDALADIKSLAARVLSTAHEFRNAAGPMLWGLYEEGRTHAVAKAAKRPGFMCPPVPAAALAVTVAMEILDKTSITEAASGLRQFSQGNRRYSAPTAIGDWGRHTSTVFRQALLSSQDLHYSPSTRIRIKSTTAHPIDVIAQTIPPAAHLTRRRSVPALFWHNAAMLLAPPGFSMISVRLALSVAVLQVGSPLSHRELAALLQSPADRNVTRVLVAASAGEWTHFASSLTRIADYLDGGNCPIDYQHRREINYGNLLPFEDWTSILDALKLGRSERPSLKSARNFLYETLSGSLPGEFTRPSTQENMLVLRKYTAPVIPNAVRSRLLGYGRNFLAENGAESEPVEWEPPERLFNRSVPPGSIRLCKAP